MAGSLLNAQVHPVNDWYVFTSNADSVSNGGTSTATINYTNTASSTNAGSSYIWSYFDAVSLSDGDAIRFDASMSIDYAGTILGAISGLRFGLFERAVDSGASRVVSDGTVRNDWGGVFINTGSSTVYRKDQPNTSPYATTTTTTTATLNGTVANHTFSDNVSVQLRLDLTREGDNLILGGNFAGSPIAGTFSNYFVGSSDTFDTFGFFLGSSGTNGAANSITFSDASVSVIPEPGTYALLLGGVMGAVLILRRYRHSGKRL